MQTPRMISAAGKALLLIALAGCAAQPQPSPPTGPDPVELKLAEALADTARANATAAELEKSLMMPRPSPPPEPEPAAGTVAPDRPPPVAIDWNGPALPLIHSLAAHAGYSVKFAGRPPANPVQITINGFRGSHMGAIDRINRSLFGFATVSTEPRAGAITVAYAD